MFVRFFVQAVIFALSATSLCLGIAVGEGMFKLRVLHTNDMHARFQQISQSAGKCSEKEAANNQCYGGFARVRTALQEEMAKAQSENVAVVSLNAGDNYQGTVWYTIFKWKAVLQFLDMLPFDAMSLGNHEFDDNIPGLLPFLNATKIPVIACNLDYSEEPELGKVPLKNSIILERGGHKIGIIGYLTPQTTTMSNSGNLKVLNEIESLTKEAEKMHKDGINIIIALGHSGLSEDLNIAEKVPYLDVVVGGHSHTFLYTGTPPDSDIPTREYPVIVKQSSGRMVAIVQAYAYTKYLGKFDVTFDGKGEIVEATGNPILLDYKIKEDPEVLRVIEEWKKNLTGTLNNGIGHTKVLLDGGSCKSRECNLGNLIADAFVYHAMKNHTGPHWTSAAIAIQQGGGIRSTINATSSDGTITQEDVMTVMPFFGSLSIVKMTGQTLLHALEWSVAKYDTVFLVGRGEFLQMSGMKVTYNLKNRVGSRVASVKVQCAACDVPEYRDLNATDEYKVVMPTYIYLGGDNYTAFKKNGTEVLRFRTFDTDVLLQFLNETGVIHTGLSDRIRFVSGGNNLKFKFIYLIFILCLLVIN